jgi:CRP-like cAMP-binding protein
MLDAAPHSPRNHHNQLLASLRPADLALLQAHLRPVQLALMKKMERPNRRIVSVYFMERGIASIVAVHSDDIRVEVGLIGREGMSGTAVVLGTDRSPHSTYIQVAGGAQRIAANDLRMAMSASASLRSSLLKFVQVLMVQRGETAVANARAHIEERLARWILMAHDRMDDDIVPLTHEFLALMLGVRRPGVTEALQSLKRKQLIETRRNHFVVLDRKGIERVAGEFYGGSEQEYRRLIGLAPCAAS